MDYNWGHIRNFHPCIVHRNHKAELCFQLQLIDKHNMTILTRTRQPEEQRTTRRTPRANLGLSKSCQTYLKSILDCVLFLKRKTTQPNIWCHFMRLNVCIVSSVDPEQKEWRILCLGRQTQYMLRLRKWNKLDQDIHIILRGSKCDELQLRFKINGPLVLRFVKSIHHWTMVSNYILMCLLHQHCTYSTEE